MKMIFTYLMIVALVGACNLDVKKANAPTNPPQLAKNAFNAQQLEGSYEQGGRPVMFTWPETRWDEATQSHVPLTFAEKVDVRAKISQSSDDKAKYEAEFAAQEPLIMAKYKQLGIDLDTEYKETNKCYALCDPMDFACEPDNPDNFPQFTWKEPESEEEKAIIERCQVVQDEIENLGDMETAEINKAKAPAKKASEDLLAIVGDNFFSELTTFGFKYGTMESCASMTGAAQNTCAIIDIIFADVSGKEFLFSNSPEVDADFKVMDAKMDRETGIMTFSIPAVDLSSVNVLVYGKIEFSLELNPGTGTMKVAGDIKVHDFFTGKQTIGRFDSNGVLKPL